MASSLDGAPPGPPGSGSAARPRRGGRDPWLWAALLLAAALRVPSLGAPSLWLDEALSARAATLAPAEIVDLAAADLHPPGYYLALRSWTRLWPSRAGRPSEWALRSFSVTVSMALLPVLYFLGLAWSGSLWTARAAALIAAISPYAVDLAREARGYALLMLLFASLCWCWVRLRSGGGSLATGATTLLLALSLWVHYMSLLFGLALTVTVVAIERRPEIVRRWLFATAVAVLLWLPWVPTLVRQIAAGGRSWIDFDRSPLLILRTVAGFFRGDASSGELLLWTVPVLLLIVAGTRSGGASLGWLLGLSMAIPYAVSRTTNVWDPRYLGGAATAAFLLAARGLARPTGARVIRAGAALVLVAMLLGIPRARRGTEDWRGLVGALPPGPVVVVHPWVEPFAPFDYYAVGHDLVNLAGLRPADGALLPDPTLSLRLSDVDEVFLIAYLEDLYDPRRATRSALAAAGLEDEGVVFQSARLALRRYRREGGSAGQAPISR